jgi:Spy/CpxP family protein refolding chaperone
LLLILACPLMMIWMMRGMHGGTADAGNAQGHAAGCSDGHHNSTASLDELRRQRDQLDREIEQREADEQTPTPVGGGWR